MLSSLPLEKALMCRAPVALIIKETNSNLAGPKAYLAVLLHIPCKSHVGGHTVNTHHYSVITSIQNHQHHRTVIYQETVSCHVAPRSWYQAHFH